LLNYRHFVRNNGIFSNNKIEINTENPSIARRIFKLLKDIYNKYGIAIGAVDEIRAFHILEHLHPENRVKVMRLFFDLLKPGGILHIEVPIAGTVQFYQDPTHLSPWTARTFWYFTKRNKFGEAFAKRNTDARLFEKIQDEIIDEWKYRIKLKKP